MDNNLECNEGGKREKSSSECQDIVGPLAYIYIGYRGPNDLPMPLPLRAIYIDRGGRVPHSSSSDRGLCRVGYGNYSWVGVLVGENRSASIYQRSYQGGTPLSLSVQAIHHPPRLSYRIDGDGVGHPYTVQFAPP